MSWLAQLVCFCTSVAYAPVPQMSKEVWDIRYTYEALSHGRHLLRLSTTDLLLDADRSRRHRLAAFAQDFASRTCAGRFVFIDGDRLTSYAGQFVFRCR